MNTIQKLQSSTACPAPTGQRLVGLLACIISIQTFEVAIIIILVINIHPYEIITLQAWYI